MCLGTFRNWVTATQSQGQIKLERLRSVQVWVQGLPLSPHTPSTPCCWTRLYWESFLSGSAPQVNLLTGQQMESGGTQTTAPPAHMSMCFVCVCVGGVVSCWLSGCVLSGQHRCRCRCDRSCMLLTPPSLIVQTWRSSLPFVLAPPIQGEFTWKSVKLKSKLCFILRDSSS